MLRAFLTAQGRDCEGENQSPSSRGKAKGKGLWLTCPNPIGKTNHAIYSVCEARQSSLRLMRIASQNHKQHFVRAGLVFCRLVRVPNAQT